LHPDRETNPDERMRKTELMQKINIAYDKHDLLTMLQMQLEIEQIDQIDQIVLIQLVLKKLNTIMWVLKKQLQEIKQEVHLSVNSLTWS